VNYAEFWGLCYRESRGVTYRRKYLWTASFWE